MAGLEEFCAEPIEGRDGRGRPCDRTRREHIEGHLGHPFRPWVYSPDGWVPARLLGTLEAS